MRFGGPVEGFSSPEEWLAKLKELGYSAAYCPVGPDEGEDVEKDYGRAASEAGIVIAETGAWCNPISPDEEERATALERCKQMLALADRMGARCCANVSGSRGKIMLVPKGAKKPKVFQRNTPIKNCSYISNPKAFYPQTNE